MYQQTQNRKKSEDRLHVSGYRGANIIHTEHWTHGGLNNAQNVFLFKTLVLFQLCHGQVRKALPAYTYSRSGVSWEWRYINLTPRPLLPIQFSTRYLTACIIYWLEVGKVWVWGWIIMFILHCGLYDLVRNSQFLTAVWVQYVITVKPLMDIPYAVHG